MKSRRLAAIILTLLLLLACAAVRNGRGAERTSLDRATIIVDAAEPSFVQYGVEDMAGYVKEATGRDIPIANSADAAMGTRILVGAKAARLVLPDGLPSEKAGEEAYLLRSVSKDGVDYVIAAGATSRGTKAALATLMKTIQVEGRSAFLPAALNHSGKPPLARRGMHFNGWAFNSPYSFRNWREQDWKNYLDILAYQGVNLFYLWPFMEIMPVPLSPEDRAYLEECRRVIDYAQRKHGMEVWIMQCTNRVARDRCGVADPRRRSYWRPSQQDLNPGKPEDFKAIMASREAMYRILDNVDGVCNIDSDPGECPGSPLSDYVKVLSGCRELLERHNLHGPRVKMISWMWSGWGTRPGQAESPAAVEDRHRRTIEALKKGLPQRWDLIAGWGGLLPICRSENVLNRTVLLPYGVIEGEPSYPATNLSLDNMRPQFRDVAAKYPAIEGMMGNVQTPLLQFPHVFYFTSAMFDAAYHDRPEKDVLSDLCRHLYPEHAELLADCYLGLRESDAAKVQSLADRLDRLIRDDNLGRLGIFGRKLFPDHRIVAQMLRLQLSFRAAGQRLAQNLTPTTSMADCEKLLADYFDSYLAWDTAHGWHNLWGWNAWQVGPPAGVAEKLAKCLGERAAVDACLRRVGQTLAAKYDKTSVEVGCIAPLRNAARAALPIARRSPK